MNGGNVIYKWERWVFIREQIVLGHSISIVVKLFSSQRQLLADNLTEESYYSNWFPFSRVDDEWFKFFRHYMLVSNFDFNDRRNGQKCLALCMFDTNLA